MGTPERGRSRGGDFRQGPRGPRRGKVPAEPEPRPVAAPRAFPSARTPECRALLEEGLMALDLGAGEFPSLRPGLDAWLKEVELWNPRLGLVEAGGEDLMRTHVLDSLAPARIFLDMARELAPASGPLRVADLGSGGGFPGIALALVLADSGLDWTLDLREKQERRANFLRGCLVYTGLRDRVRVCQSVLEGMDRPTGTASPARDGGDPVPVPPDMPEGGYHLVTARAFRPLDALVLPAMRALLAPSGRLFLYKGRQDGVAEELSRVGLGAGGSDTGLRLLPVQVPGLEGERHVLVIRC